MHRAGAAPDRDSTGSSPLLQNGIAGDADSTSPGYRPTNTASATRPASIVVRTGGTGSTPATRSASPTAPSSTSTPSATVPRLIHE